MMSSEAKIYAAFGEGSLVVGAFKITEPEVWCITIKELKQSEPVGSVIAKDAEIIGQTEIVMSFLSERHMLSVLAAFTNKSYEEALDKWKFHNTKEAQ